MKKICPFCNAEIKPSLDIRKNDIRPYTVRCKNCGKSSRKKFSIYYIVEFIFLCFCSANFKTHWLYSVATIILLIVLFLTYRFLPYVPYDE